MDIYDGKQAMKIVGIREHQVELEGDFSGGTHHTTGKAWFPKEGLMFEIKEESTELTRDDVTESKNLLYESDDVMMEACLIVRQDGSIAYDNIYINLTDKTPKKRKDWKEHFLDNPRWFFGILDGDDESIDSALEIINHNQFLQLKDFITYLYNNEWLRKPIEYKVDYPKFLKRPSDNQLFALHEETQLYKSFPWMDESKPYPQFNYQTLIEHYGFIPCDSFGKPLIS
jgi:hypothetical protein